MEALRFLKCRSYKVDLSPLLDKLHSIKPRRILLHAPDGLKHLYDCLLTPLGEMGLEVYLSLTPGYGACDIPLEEAQLVRADMIIHIGHLEYHLAETRQELSTPVVYLPAYYAGEIDRELVSRLIDALREKNCTSVSISSTLADLYLRENIARHLEKSGFVVYEVKEPVLGCFYAPVLQYESRIDCHVVISGGLFHPVGLGLVSSKPIIAVDPYMNKIWNASVEAAKILKRRLFKVLMAKNTQGRRIGIITGGRPGQFRPSLVKLLEDKAIKAGYTVYKLIIGYLTLERLVAIDDSLNLDFYVVTSCPRLPIDDLEDFHKPVLTPGEFIMLVDGIDRYIYPW